MPNNPGEKKVVAHDFGKQPERFPQDFKKELDLEQEELIVENSGPAKPVKKVISFKSGGERFPEPKVDPFLEDKPITELKVDVNEALKATKPNVPVVDFKRYPKSSKDKTTN